MYDVLGFMMWLLVTDAGNLFAFVFMVSAIYFTKKYS